MLQDLCGLSEVIAKVKHNVIMINNTSLTALQYRNGGDGCGRDHRFPYYKHMICQMIIENVEVQGIQEITKVNIAKN
jgi:NACalpha-BTF3-like transcription factor